jgi:hypothetical protein
LPKFIKSFATEARTSLARLHSARSEAAAEARGAQSRIDRLAELANAVAPIAAKLAVLDANEAEAFAAWARSPASPAPSPDTSARVDLQRELAEAQATADAATRAVPAMRREVDVANAKAAAAAEAVPLAAALVALEELPPMIEAAKAAVATIARVRDRSRVMLNEILSVAEGPTVRPEARAAFLETYLPAAAAMNDAGAAPLPAPSAATFRGPVLALLAALNADASAKLEG